MSQDKIDMLKRALSREKAARKQAEKILENKAAELYEAKQKLEKSYSELEALLYKTDSQLQGVFENIVDAYVIMDLMGNILKMNDAAVSLLGFKDAKVNFNLLEMVDPIDVERVHSSFKSLIKEGSITDLHLNIITQKQEKLLVHINASIIYDEGLPMAAQGIVRDITIANKYKKSLEAEKNKYWNIIANMNLGLVEIGVDDKIVMVNQSFSKMSGYTPQEVIGKTGKELFINKENAKIIEDKDVKRHNGESHSYEIKVKNKLGEERHWLISGGPNYNLKGEVEGSIGIHLDITDIKRLEHQKERLLKELEKSNNELQEYAHIVSNDLKSPLRSIDALINWIKEDNKEKLDEVSIQNFDLIETTLEKMEQLISDILTYSSAGSQTLAEELVDLNEIVEGLTKILFIPNHISIEIINPLPKIQGDKTKLQQLFQNLISNAVKFNDKAIGRIEIDVTAQDENYLFSVKDNGVGIDKKYHDKIFKIFHALNKSKDSTGIGLSIVKKIVELHKGDIWVESKLGEGTTFYFTLKK